MKKATDRPWEAKHVGEGDYDIIDPKRRTIAELTYFNREANAALIVRAVNSHEALVEALTFALEQLIDPNRGPSGTKAAQEQAHAALKLAGE